jgi:hypothetical protein
MSTLIALGIGMLIGWAIPQPLVVNALEKAVWGKLWSMLTLSSTTTTTPAPSANTPPPAANT